MQGITRGAAGIGSANAMKRVDITKEHKRPPRRVGLRNGMNLARKLAGVLDTTLPETVLHLRNRMPARAAA
jgi:hypothetical protein